jgi:hypothetical protein
VKKTDPKRRCKAHSRSGKQCGNAPIMGGMVCRMHGGSAPQVKRKAAERLADLIDPDRALREMARLAYSDVRSIFDAEGKLLPVQDWPDELAAAVGGIEVVKRNVDSGDGKIDDVIKIKVWDKPKALEMIAKHLNLFKEQVEHSGSVTFKWEGE